MKGEVTARNDNCVFTSKEHDTSWVVTRFGNLVLLKSHISHLDTPGYLVGYIIIKVGRVVTLGGYGFISSTKQERWIYVCKCVNLEIFSDFDNLM